jgi:hypothetical protein
MTPFEDRGAIRVPSLWFLLPCAVATLAAVGAALALGDAVLAVGLGLAACMTCLAAAAIVRLRRV